MGQLLLFSLLAMIGISAQGQISYPTPPPAQAPAPAAGSLDANGNFSGVPHLVRDYPVPQVFFSDPPASFYVPVNEDYNRIMSTLNSALARKVPVKITVDKKTKTITEIDAPKAASTGSIYEDPIEDTAAKKPGGSSGGGAAAGVTPVAVPGGIPAVGAPPAAAPSPKPGWKD